MCFEVAGTITGILVYTLYYIGLSSESVDCKDGNRVPDTSLRAVYRWHALTLSVLTIIYVFITVVGVREQEGMKQASLQGCYNCFYSFHD